LLFLLVFFSDLSAALLLWVPQFLLPSFLGGFLFSIRFFHYCVRAGFPLFSNILLAILLSFFSVVILPLAACIMYSGICFTMSSYSLRRVTMLIWVFFLHLVIVASPFHPHSRLSWICAWSSSFVHGVPSVFTASPTLLSCRIFFHTSFFILMVSFQLGVLPIPILVLRSATLAVSVVICFSSCRVQKYQLV